MDPTTVFLIIVVVGGLLTFVCWLASYHPTPSMQLAQGYAIPRSLRLQHLAAHGASGSGKSTALLNWAIQDARAGHGLILIDIKDTMCLDLAAYLPPGAAERTILVDLTDTIWPIAFNPFAGVPAARKTLATGELLSSLKRMYAESWGPRLEHILRASLQLLLDVPDATLLDLVRLLTDAGYRAWAITQTSNFSVRAFWEQEFPAIAGKNGSLSNLESILNKLGVFAYPELRNIIGQTRRGLDFDRCIAESRLVLIHAPQGRLGEDVAFFMASVFLSRFQLAAQARVSLPPQHRKAFYGYFDEVQNYQTSALDKLITEGRSMGVGCVVASQFPEQLPQQLRLALNKNLPYQVMAKKSTQGGYTLELTKLQEPNAPDAVRLLYPLLPPSKPNYAQLDAIRQRSRALLAQPRAEVEREIARRLCHLPNPSHRKDDPRGRDFPLFDP